MKILTLTEKNNKSVIGELNKFFNKPKKKSFTGFTITGDRYTRKNNRLPKQIIGHSDKKFSGLLVDFDYDETLKISANPEHEDDYDQYVYSIWYGDKIILNGNNLHIISTRNGRKNQQKFKVAVTFSPATLKAFVEDEKQ